MSALEVLGSLEELTQLNLHFAGNSQVTSIDLKPLEQLKSLTRLRINALNSQVREFRLPEPLRGLTGLTLDAGGSQIRDLESLMQLKSLTYLSLDLAGSEVSAVNKLGHLKALKQLNLVLSEKIIGLEWLENLSQMNKLSLATMIRTQRMSLQKLPPSVVELSF